MFSDSFSDSWKLLSETTRFLERTPLFLQYEEELRCWRRDLQIEGKKEAVARHIRHEIIELRKSLRNQGYDLSLARQNLVIDGFRNDASLAEGFRRVVIFFCDYNAFWISGENNHITLAGLLEQQVSTRMSRHNCAIRSKHFLWYRRKGNDLILSGADTETKDDFERLSAMAEANSLYILARLKELK